jgi:hypothetical protein
LTTRGSWNVIRWPSTATPATGQCSWMVWRNWSSPSWTAYRVRRLAFRHPNMVPLLVSQSLATSLGFRLLGTLHPLERILGLLSEAGFNAGDALRL